MPTSVPKSVFTAALSTNISRVASRRFRQHLPLRSTDAAAVPSVGAALRPLLDAHLSVEGDQGQQHCCLCCDVR